MQSKLLFNLLISIILVVAGFAAFRYLPDIAPNQGIYLSFMFLTGAYSGAIIYYFLKSITDWYDNFNSDNNFKLNRLSDYEIEEDVRMKMKFVQTKYERIEQEMRIMINELLEDYKAKSEKNLAEIDKKLKVLEDKLIAIRMEKISEMEAIRGIFENEH